MLRFTHNSSVMVSLVLSEDAIDLGDFVEGEKAAPEDGRAGRAVMLATEVTAESGEPGDGLAQGRRLWGRRGGAVDATVERLPLDRRQQHVARQIGVEAGEQRRVEDA